MTMRPLAHLAGEQGLAPLLLLLGGGGVPLLVAIGRAQLAAARAKLTRKQGAHRPPARWGFGHERRLPGKTQRPGDLKPR
jgi:hypothetical protein